MEVELINEEMSSDENYVFDDNEDYLNFDGERCGICMDIVIDRGVLDCCQHWFCFACIDNWSTITSLCPLCQNEFQVITCLPVYDTVGCSKTDEDTTARDDDWFVEGKNNTLSFPSYYIDENAVVCLDGNGCKVRSGSMAIEEDSDVDTSIACDSCDKWYHAFCVGFDPESTCSSWLCPRCTGSKVTQNSNRIADFTQILQHDFEFGDGGAQVETSFSGRVSVSVADDCETAVIVSLVDINQGTQESSKSVFSDSKDETTTIPSSTFDHQESEVLLSNVNCVEPNSNQQEMELSLSHDSHSQLSAQLNINGDEDEKGSAENSNNKFSNSSLVLGFGLSGRSHVSDCMNVIDASKDKSVPGNVEELCSSEQFTFQAVKRLSDYRDSKSAKGKETITAATGAKRKHRDTRNAGAVDREDNSEATFSRKKIKLELNGQCTSQKDPAPESVVDDCKAISSQSTSDSKLKCLSENKNGVADIMAIVQATDRKSLKQVQRKSSPAMIPDEKETAAGLRLKKIMRRTGDDKDSSTVVQELRKKIREAVRNKSSSEVDENLFDPKLLDAFRAALAGSGTENRKPTLDIKAKKSLLEKGKVRENLTKKIYGIGGKRKRAWTRECEVEFWKHRCLKTTRPEKVQTLKSVLDVLKDDPENKKKINGHYEEQKTSILSRLYLADTSVFPRKNDIKPVSALNGIETHEQKSENSSAEKIFTSQTIDHSDRITQKNNNLSQVTVPPIDSKATKKNIKGVKSESASGEAHQRGCQKGASTPASIGHKTPSDKELTSKPDVNKGDKRQWALELLARKTATSGKNVQDKEEDNTILKGNYSLLAQLPKEMRPVLAPSCRNKIPTSVRQAQLYRLTEHFLKKANPSSVVGRTAETELAVADAVNIEKQVADRSNSKLVYVNLCSQELQRRQDNTNPDRAKDLKSCSTSEDLPDVESVETNNSSVDLAVDEALRNAGLVSDSPPHSPNRPTEDDIDEVDLLENMDEGPDSILEADSRPELDIYGDFEYDLEDEDFIGACTAKISKLESEEPKIKLVFTSVNPDKILDGTAGHLDHEVTKDVEASNGDMSYSIVSDSRSVLASSAEGKTEEGLVQNFSANGDEDLSVTECEELYGPDKEPLIVKYPEAATNSIFDKAMDGGLAGEYADHESKLVEKDSGKSTDSHAANIEVASDSNSSASRKLLSDSEKTGNVKKEPKSKSDTKKSENNGAVAMKVEAYIKEHIRPLCKSGVITVEQYRWAVGRTTEKVMHYHSKDRNANFLIKEGEKVKKLAEQYVEASQQKAKNS